MHYQFPEIHHINDVLPAIKGYDEFKVIDKGTYTVIDYVYLGDQSFSIGPRGKENLRHALLRRECRGIVFDADGKLISRPFHKFFNINEREETASHRIDLTRPHEIMVKADGSMLRPVLINGIIVPMTRKGYTEVAQQAWKEAVDDLNISEMHGYLKNGFTPIYEFVSPRNKIVVEYDRPRWILLAVRENFSGRYLDISVAEELKTDFPSMHVDDFVKEVKNTNIPGKELEGYVINFDDGHKVKIKTEDYLRLHRVIDTFESEKNILNIILNGQTDDLYPELEEKKKNQLRAFEGEINHRVSIHASKVRSEVDALKDLSQKEFALWVQSNTMKKLRPLFFQYRKTEGRDIDLIYEYMLKHTGSATKIEEIRFLIGKPWSEYK